ncbi:hypothetical protein [Salinicoccus roseus]|uniref:hypothetical protein n=1 Tax=Salinicoccus roseus TaxID=45670 RepID=UPI001EF46287|nr:hypothetical protein [Salinicoccus roseus]MCG7332145.1 hypothetical protein [Salinicoccus roseus]
MTGEISVSEQIEAVRRKYDDLIGKEEYNLKTYDHNERQRQKILNKLYKLQESERTEIKGLERRASSVGVPGMRKDGWEHCPRCGSNRVKQKGKIDHAFALWMSGFVFILLGLIIWPLIIIGVLLFLISPIGFLGAKMNVCRDCKKQWIANKA